MLIQPVKKYFLVYAAVLLLFACNSNSAQKKVKESSLNHATRVKSAENFDLFFKKFNADSVFQKSRVAFPLKVVIAGGEGESDSTKYISDGKWQGGNLMAEKKHIIKKIKNADREIVVQFNIEDTGVGIYYYFAQKKGKWWLVFIKDASD
jgi:hypothetical protein